jgi:fido (protein-threonine AMPylation protein)
LDRLSRENHLKGLSAEEWAGSASAYLYDLGTIQPFLAGSEVALQEFAVELARKNNLGLHWDATHDIASGSMALLSQAEQSANLRRLIMLAMDTGPIVQPSNSGHRIERGMESVLTIGNLLL